MATSLAVLLILESLLESGKVELTSEMKRDPAQWNCKRRNARQHGEEREEGGGDLKKKKKKQPIWSWPSSEIHTALGIYFQSWNLKGNHMAIMPLFPEF